MSGCLSLPFRLLGLAIVALLCYLAWIFRADIKRKVHEWTGDGSAPAAGAPVSHASASGLLHRLDSLGSGTSDSVMLSGPEAATLAQAFAQRALPGAVDSVTIEFGTDEVTVRARVDTHRVPVSLGPLSGITKDHEFIDAGGRLVYRRAGLAEWEVDRIRVRGVPVPKRLVSGLLNRLGGSTVAGSTIQIPTPPSVTGLRVSPRGIVVYGRGAGGI